MLLGIALSIRTLAAAIFSYKANDIIKKIGLFWSLIASQIFGCLALAVLFLGFHFKVFALTALGIVLTGLPSTFVAILITIILRVSSDNSALFRKYSGRRELVFGIAMLASSILAPILLWKFNLNFVLAIDIVSYIIGFFLLLNLKISNQGSEEDEHKTLQPLRYLVFNSNAQEYLLKTNACLLLAGLLPLLASSSQINFTMDMPILFRQWLWSIEDITAISASLLYLFFTIIKKNKFFTAIVMMSGVWLIVPLQFENNYSIIISAVVICLLTDFSGQKFRDDLVISAGDDLNLIKSYSALSLFQRNFVFFISPVLLSLLFTFTSTPISVSIIIFIQFVLFFLYKYFTVKH